MRPLVLFGAAALAACSATDSTREADTTDSPAPTEPSTTPPLGTTAPSSEPATSDADTIVDDVGPPGAEIVGRWAHLTGTVTDDTEQLVIGASDPIFASTPDVDW